MNVRPHVIFLGQKPIGEHIFEDLVAWHKEGEIELAVASSNASSKGWWQSAGIREIAFANGITFLDNLDKADNHLALDSINIMKNSWLISIQHPWKLETRFIDKFQGRTMNLHLAPLPEYRGWYGPSHAIIRKDTSYGWTLHQICERLDEGPIILQGTLPIRPSDTALSLYSRTVSDAHRNFRSVFLSLVDGDTPHSIEQIGEGTFFAKDSLDKFRILRMKDLHCEEIERIARALHFPPYRPLRIENQGQEFEVIPIEELS